MGSLVSVVMPAYNRSTQIVDALKSIQAQTYQDWEAIVVDDGSTDDTSNVVSQMAKQDMRIRLIWHKRNRGAQATRNTGIQAAKGKWIAFLDSDDRWLKDSLELRLKRALKENVYVVHSDCYIIRENGKIELYSPSRISGRVYKNLLAKSGPMFQACLIAKEALKRIGYLDEKIVSFQEWDTAIRLAKFYSFGFEPKPTFIYDYTTPDSISRDSVRNAKGYHYIVQKHFAAILRYTGPEVLSYHYGIVASWYRKGRDEIRARRYTMIALLWKCFSPRKIYRKLKWFILSDERMKRLINKIKYFFSIYLAFYLIEIPLFFIWKIKNRSKGFELSCYYPFYYLGINSNGTCYLCCSTWLPNTVGNLKYDSIKRIFNSIQAQRMRIAFYKGDLSYCKTMLCDIVNSRNYKPFTRQYITDSNLLTERTKKEVLRRKLKITDGPSRITEGISSICNIRCKFCGSRTNRCDDELIEKMKIYIINSIDKMRLLNFSASGEPFIQKYVKDIIESARQNKGVSFYFTSNLNYIDAETRSALGEINVAQLHASINASNRETYNKITERGDWENVMKNLDFFIDLREKKNKNMWIQTSMVVTNQNYKDIINFAKFGIEKKLNKVIIYPMIESENNKYLQIDKNEILEIEEMLNDKIFENSAIEILPLRDVMKKILVCNEKYAF